MGRGIKQRVEEAANGEDKEDCTSQDNSSTATILVPNSHMTLDHYIIQDARPAAAKTYSYNEKEGIFEEQTGSGRDACVHLIAEFEDMIREWYDGPLQEQMTKINILIEKFDGRERPRHRCDISSMKSLHH